MKAYIDIILFLVFLLLNLIIGLLAGRKVKSLREFSIGNKDFSTATITSTIVATWIGGGFMFYTLQNTYTNGLHFIISITGASLGLLLTGQILSIRMGEFLNNFSVAEVMGDLYGPIVRIITATSGILLGIGYVSIQFQVIGKVITFILGIEGQMVTITAACIVVVYSALGGIRSVTITDIFQFIAFSIFVPILVLIVWNGLHDPKQVAHTLTTNPLFNLRSTIGWNSNFISTIGLMLYFAIPGINPTAFQRIAMAKDLIQVKKSFTYSAGFSFLIYMFASFLAILLLADDPNLDSKNLVNHIINHYAYPGLKGLIAIGIASMAMSTADSYLNAASILAVHDIIKPLKSSFNESIAVTRLFSVILGIFGLLLAMRTSNIIQLMLIAGGFYMPIVTVPLLLAIFGFRGTTKCVLLGMGAGFITMIFWDKFFGYTGLNKVIPGMLANLIFFIGSHYILRQPGGWVGIKEKGPLLAAKEKRKDAWKKIVNLLKHPNIYIRMQKSLPDYEVVYSLFAIYVLGATYSCFFTIPEVTVASYQKVYDFIVHSVIIITACFLTFPAWPPRFKNKRFITFAWPAGICYILFVVGTLLVIMSGFHQVQVMIFMINLILTSFLLTWPLMLLIAGAGMLIGWMVFCYHYGPIPYIHTADLSQFKVICSILITSSFLITVFRFRQKQGRLEDQKAYFFNKYEERNNELGQIMAYREELLKELKGEEIILLDHTAAAYMQQAVYRITDYIKLEVSKFAIEDLTEDVKNILKLQGLHSNPSIIIRNNTKQEFLQADKVKLEQMLINSITCIQKHNEINNPITLFIEDATLGHSIDYMIDYTRQLAAIKFVVTTRDIIPLGKEVYRFDEGPSINRTVIDGCKDMLIENARIVDAHYGYGKLNKLDTHTYVVPVNVREVRGKVMELLREPIEASEEELSHPVALQLERDLLERIQGKNLGVALIHKALDVIKKYHAGVKRKSGEPFFTHPIAVALILLGYCQDQDALIAALLHDTVEDTSLSITHVEAMFGKEVAFIVSKVTNLEDKIRRVSLTDHENIYRLSHAADKRALYVKLADRLHNMRTISGHSSIQKQKHIANETINFFVVAAKNLELTGVANELEKLSLEVLGRK